jgi:hypothetical protein
LEQRLSGICLSVKKTLTATCFALVDDMEIMSKLRQHPNLKTIIGGAVVALLLIVLFSWLRRPIPLSLVELAEQKTQCVLWRDEVDLNLASLATKYISDRDLYLLQAHRRIDTLFKTQLAQCSPETNRRDIDKTLEQLAIQLSQKDDTALQTINRLQALF